MAEGYTGMVEAGGKRYMATSLTESREEIERRILRQQAAGKELYALVIQAAEAYDVTSASVIAELEDLDKDNKEG
jgi:hypothetical protein